MTKRPLLLYLLIISALILSTMSGFFSIFGLAALFAGAKLPIVIMACGLEFAKIITISVFYNWKKNFGKIHKIYMIIAIIILTTLSSIGVYGFLSNAYTKTSKELTSTGTQEQLNTDKQNIVQNKIDLYKTQSTSYYSRIKILNEQRSKQEERLNQAMTTMNRKWITSARTDIEQTDKEIDELNGKIESNLTLLNSENEKMGSLKQQNSDIQVKGSSVDVGPLRYIAKLLGTTMDKVVNWVILLIMFVLDPLAIMMIWSTNLIIAKNSQRDKIIAGQKKVQKEDVTKDFNFDNMNQDEKKDVIKSLYANWKENEKKDKELSSGKINEGE